MKTNSEIYKFCNTHNACSDGRNWAMTQASMADVFDNCERGDWLMWALHKQNALDKHTSVKLACEFALRVLPKYEAKYSNKAPRKAIEAALAWLKNQTQENASAAAAAPAAYAVYAATSASGAADAAYAAYAAATSAAASASGAAASAATHAATYAATSASGAAAYAAAERKSQCEIIRNLVKNPWRK